MHELALAEGILAVALRTLASQLEGKVTLIKLKIGQLTHVENEALELAFTAVARDTAAEGAKLLIERVQLRLRCLECGDEIVAARYRISCESCGSAQSEIIAGRELAVEYVEVE